MIKYKEEENLYCTGVERSFIACIMRFPNLVTMAEASVSVDDIYSPNFHILYKIILKMKEHYDLKQEKYVFTQELISMWLETAEEEDKRVISNTISNFSFLTMIQNAPGVDMDSFEKYVGIIKRTSSLIKA